MFILAGQAPAGNLPLELIQLPPGFTLSLYTDKVPNARSMSLSPGGTLFVGSRHGKVYAVSDSDHDGRGDTVYTLAKGLNSPNGVAFYAGSLYVAEIDRILRFDMIEGRLKNPPSPVVVSRDFPSDKHHGWKFIRVGPDNKLYVPIGAPCNVCLEYGYAVITRLNLDGSQHEIYAEGVRNSVGFDWHPDTKQLWFTDNGRDRLGDDIPADELNRVDHEGQHFGFPYCHGGDVLDPEFGLGHKCKEYVAPVQKLGPHVASLGMRFYTGKMFPAFYRKQVFIAEHGSWNRSEKIGYRISLVKLKDNKAVSYEPFAFGWLQGQAAWGRPVDIEQMADGSLLVSDDKAGAIYRISYDAARAKLPVRNRKGYMAPAKQGGRAIERSNTVPENARGKQTMPSVRSQVQPVQAKQALPPQGIHESLLQQRRAKNPQLKMDKTDSTQSSANSSGQKSVDTPPADLVEKIRARSEKNTQPQADPFSPLNKQIVEQ